MTYFLGLTRLEAIDANADTFSADDTYIQINGDQVFQRDFNTGDVAFLDTAKKLDRPAQINLYDEDNFLNFDDDFIGGITINPPSSSGSMGQPQFNTVTLSGSGSEYQLSYYTVNLSGF